MSVPNLKRIALFVQKLLGGSQNFEIRSRDLGLAHLWVVLWSGRSRCPSSMSVPNLKWIALFFQKLLGGSQNFEFGSSHFMIQTHYGPVLYICAEFEADISIRSKVIRGSQNFEIRSRDPGHAHFGVAV